MNVAFCSSDLYAKCTGIAIYSLLENNKDLSELNIFVITTDMKDNNKKTIGSMCQKYKRNVTFIDGNSILSSAKESMGLIDFKGGLNTYARALACRLIPDSVGKVLFLDSDLLINGSLRDLETLDMKDSIVAGVCEISVLIKDLCYEDVTLLNQCKNYLNYGVVLINLDNWRKFNGNELINKTIRSAKGHFKVAEQSFVNLAFKDRTMVLPLKYNYSTYVHNVPYERMRKWYKRRDVFPKEEYEEALSNPVIIHFIGDYFNRPWYKKNTCRYKNLYMKYYRDSPWKDSELDDPPSNISIPFKMYYAVLIFLRKHHFDNAYFGLRYLLIQWFREHVKDLDGKVKRTK